MTDELVSAPLTEALLAHRQRDYAPFNVPGHKQGRGASPLLREALGQAFFDVDVPIFSGLQDTRQTEDLLGTAQALAAEAWGVDRAYFLVNGSSSGIHALVLAVARPGEDLIVPRNAHKSLHTALILSGARPVWIDSGSDPYWGAPLPASSDAVDASLRAHPGATGVVVGTPTWEGLCGDVAAIADVVHRRTEAPLVVDHAWGAALRFCEQLPPDAMAAGADACVVSIHKTLAGLTQAAMVLARGGRIDPGRLETAVGMTQTTSPMVPILASIDAVRAQMVADGERSWSRALESAASIRRSVAELDGFQCLGDECTGWPGVAAFEPTHVTITARDLGVSGWDLEKIVRGERAVALDLADDLNVVFLLSHGTTDEDVSRLLRALEDAAARARGLEGSAREAVPAALRRPPLPPQVLLPREAFYAQAKPLPLGASVGRVSAELLTPYPPGIPVLVPGERVTEEIVDYVTAALAQGVRIHGPHDATLRTVRVVADAGGD